MPEAPIRYSQWTFRQNVVRAAWMSFPRRFLWKLSARLRAPLLRLFGASVGGRCRFASTCDVAIPWNVRLGDGVEIGHRVLLYSLGVITIGDGTVIDYHAHLCAGTHDFTDPRFPLLTPPITIGPRTFIGIDAYIAPGVTLGEGCRVWPRSSVYRSFPAGSVLQGNPARAVTGSGPPVAPPLPEQVGAPEGVA